MNHVSAFTWDDADLDVALGEAELVSVAVAVVPELLKDMTRSSMWITPFCVLSNKSVSCLNDIEAEGLIQNIRNKNFGIVEVGVVPLFGNRDGSLGERGERHAFGNKVEI
jgi:hypothetical protein